MHPDLTWVTPSGAAEMLVSDIDEPVVAAATRTPFEARRRVFVIERAETMNDAGRQPDAQDARGARRLRAPVLLTDRPGEILPTIASRCQHVRFDAPSADEIAARLQGIDPSHGAGVRAPRPGRRRARGAARASATGPRCARAPRPSPAARCTTTSPSARGWRSSTRAKALGDAAQADVEARLTEELELPRPRASASAPSARTPRRPSARPAARARGALDHGARSSSACGSATWPRWSTALAEVVHAVDRLDALSADAEGRGPHALRRAVELVDDTRARLILNVSEELLLEALAYRLARVLAAH